MDTDTDTDGAAPLEERAPGAMSEQAERVLAALFELGPDEGTLIVGAWLARQHEREDEQPMPRSPVQLDPGASALKTFSDVMQLLIVLEHADLPLAEEQSSNDDVDRLRGTLPLFIRMLEKIGIDLANERIDVDRIVAAYAALKERAFEEGKKIQSRLDENTRLPGKKTDEAARTLREGFQMLHTLGCPPRLASEIAEFCIDLQWRRGVNLVDSLPGLIPSMEQWFDAVGIGPTLSDDAGQRRRALDAARKRRDEFRTRLEGLEQAIGDRLEAMSVLQRHRTLLMQVLECAGATRPQWDDTVNERAPRPARQRRRRAKRQAAQR